MSRVCNITVTTVDAAGAEGSVVAAFMVRVPPVNHWQGTTGACWTIGRSHTWVPCLQPWAARQLPSRPPDRTPSLQVTPAPPKCPPIGSRISPSSVASVPMATMCKANQVGCLQAGCCCSG